MLLMHVAYSKSLVPKLVVGGEIVALEPDVHPAYCEVIRRSGEELGRSFDQVAAAIEDLINLAHDYAPPSAYATLVRDAHRELENHEGQCERAVWWSKVIADME